MPGITLKEFLVLRLDADYVNFNSLTWFQVFTSSSFLTFAIVALCAAMDATSNVHKLWLIGICFTAITGFFLVAQTIGLIMYYNSKGKGMPVLHNAPIIICYIVQISAYALIIAFTYLWLDSYAPPCCGSVVFNDDTAPRPLRSYFSLQITIFMLGVISTYVGIRSFVAHIYPLANVSMEKSN